SVGTGLSLACDTLISQTYGSKNLKHVGMILQRGILILLLFCFPCWALFINTEQLLLAVKQDPEVARLSQTYVNIFIPALPAAFLYQLLSRYLQNQAIVMPLVYTRIAANLLNALLSYIFIWVLHLDVLGSAWANTISQFAQTILLFLYIWWKKLYVETWEGWTGDCLQEWGSFIKLAIPSMFMVCIVWWANVIGIFLAGLISQDELGAQSILCQLFFMQYTITSGIGGAASVQIRNILGTHKHKQLKPLQTVHEDLLCSFFFLACVAIILTAIFAGLKDVAGYIFTHEKETVVLAAKIMPIFMVLSMFVATTTVCSGILRSVGKQKIGAIINLIGFYGIGIPIGVALMFATKLGTTGLWTGLLICAVVQSTLFIILILRLNWNVASEQAQVRAGVKAQAISNAYSSCDSCENQGHTLPQESAAPEGGIIVFDVYSGESHSGTAELLEDSATRVAITTVGEVLSVKQLIIQRGSALLAGLVVLALRIVIYVTLSP
uniref:Multidrug and toxin extrusion protein n=1 Tax=Latimeria chalumnae TaxID=7897 RepID=H2ZWV6_LATCH